MKITTLTFSLAFLATMTTSILVAGEGYKKLRGSYAVSSATLVDPLPDQKEDRMAFFLEGDAARDMFKNLPGPARKDACSEKLVTKTSGGLSCSRDVSGDVYTCSFAIMFDKGRLVSASVC